MARPAPLSRARSNRGTSRLELVWPEHPHNRDENGNPTRGPIGNQRWFWNLLDFGFTDILFYGGISTGKTLLGSMASIRLANTLPGKTSLICAHSLPMLKKVQLLEMRRRAEEIAEHNEFPGLYHENRQDAAFSWWNKHTTFYMGTLDPQSLRGPTLSFIWADEINTWVDPAKAYRILKARLREGGKRGIFIATGTPSGRRGPMMEWENRCDIEIMPGIRVGTGINSGWLMVHLTTAQNTANPEDFAEALLDVYDAKYAEQELAGKFIDLEGRAFSDVWSMDHWPHGNIMPRFAFDPNLHELEIAIDWGDRYFHALFNAYDPESVNDPDACPDVIFDELVEEDLGDDEFIELIVDRCSRLGVKPARLYPDPEGRESNDLLMTHPFFKRSVVMLYKKSKYRRVKWGYYVARSRMRNAKGLRRLCISAELAQSKNNRDPRQRGILQGILNFDWQRTRQGHAKSELKDDSWYIHGVDALRYLLTHKYPTAYDRIRYG